MIDGLIRICIYHMIFGQIFRIDKILSHMYLVFTLCVCFNLFFLINFVQVPKLMGGIYSELSFPAFVFTLAKNKYD